MIYALSKYPTPLGRLCVVCDQEAVVASFWEGSSPSLLSKLHFEEKQSELADRWYTEISFYLKGGQREREVPFRLIGTEFQKAVWEATFKIPYGETRTYGEIAREIGNPKAFRAVAQALGANPIGIVVPCHRVVAANGPGGFNGGTNRKYFLLRLELSSAQLSQLGFHEEIH